MFSTRALALALTLSVSPMAMAIATAQTAPVAAPAARVVAGAVWMPMSKSIAPSLTCQMAPSVMLVTLASHS